MPPIKLLSALDLHALVVNKHFYCDKFTKVGTAIGIVGFGKTYRVNIQWWWGCQIPVAISLEELELIESFTCVLPVKHVKHEKPSKKPHPRYHKRLKFHNTLFAKDTPAPRVEVVALVREENMQPNKSSIHTALFPEHKIPLSEHRRNEILRLIDENPGITTQKLAKKVNYNASALKRHHLQPLAIAGKIHSDPEHCWHPGKRL
jgi:hypothetical protein